MFMSSPLLELFGADQRHQHVDPDADGAETIEDREDHGSDPPQQRGVAGERREKRDTGDNEDEVHGQPLWIEAAV
jgi:hypothetical protein